MAEGWHGLAFEARPAVPLKLDPRSWKSSEVKS